MSDTAGLLLLAVLGGGLWWVNRSSARSPGGANPSPPTGLPVRDPVRPSPPAPPVPRDPVLPSPPTPTPTRR